MLSHEQKLDPLCGCLAAGTPKKHRDMFSSGVLEDAAAREESQGEGKKATGEHATSGPNNSLWSPVQSDRNMAEDHPNQGPMKQSVLLNQQATCFQSNNLSSDSLSSRDT